MNKEEGLIFKEKMALYIFIDSDVPELDDDLIEEVSTKIGPLLLEAELISEDDVQYFHDEPDWGATLNDVLVFASDDEKITMYETLICMMGLDA
jgi:hypothetical protein